MAAGQATSTHQSWTGSVAVFLQRPARAALFGAGPSAAAAPPDAVGSAPGQRHGPGAVASGGAGALQPLPAGPQHVPQQRALAAALPAGLQPGKAGARGTWLTSRGAATLTAQLGPEQLLLRVRCKGAQAWLTGAARMPAPLCSGASPASGGQHRRRRAQQRAASNRHSAPVPAAMLLVYVCALHQVQLKGTTLWHHDLFEGAATVRLVDGPQQPEPGVASGAPGSGPLLLLQPVQQPDGAYALCFRFGSEAEGQAMAALLATARGMVLRRREELLRAPPPPQLLPPPAARQQQQQRDAGAGLAADQGIAAHAAGLQAAAAAVGGAGGTGKGLTQAQAHLPAKQEVRAAIEVRPSHALSLPALHASWPARCWRCSVRAHTLF